MVTGSPYGDILWCIVLAMTIRVSTQGKEAGSVREPATEAATSVRSVVGRVVSHSLGDPLRQVGHRAYLVCVE